MTGIALSFNSTVLLAIVWNPGKPMSWCDAKAATRPIIKSATKAMDKPYLMHLSPVINLGTVTKSAAIMLPVAESWWKSLASACL
jgi:hypothetical protein